MASSDSFRDGKYSTPVFAPLQRFIEFFSTVSSTRSCYLWHFHFHFSKWQVLIRQSCILSEKDKEDLMYLQLRLIFLTFDMFGLRKSVNCLGITSEFFTLKCFLRSANSFDQAHKNNFKMTCWWPNDYFYINRFNRSISTLIYNNENIFINLCTFTLSLQVPNGQKPRVKKAISTTNGFNIKKNLNMLLVVIKWFTFDKFIIYFYYYFSYIYL